MSLVRFPSLALPSESRTFALWPGRFTTFCRWRRCSGGSAWLPINRFGHRLATVISNRLPVGFSVRAISTRHGAHAGGIADGLKATATEGECCAATLGSAAPK